MSTDDGLVFIRFFLPEIHLFVHSWPFKIDIKKISANLSHQLHLCFDHQ